MTRRVTDISHAVLALPLALLIGVGLAGCTDEETVFVERGVFDQPTETTNNFLGYVGDPADKFPSCANCHATFFAGWATTGHQHAWESLQASGHAQGFCEGCHSISEQGNTLEGDVGYNLVADLRYTDVQCESCHGSGWDHVNDPNVANAPLCSIAAETDATTGCGECHNGTHHPFVEQWTQSGHRNVSGFAAAREGCNECHEGRASLERKFYETSNYVEKNGAETVPITCVVCHDPHGTPWEGNLRAPIDVAGDAEVPATDHLCVRCHARRGTPPSTHGPHAAQGLLVLQSDIGWLPTGFRAPSLSSHGNPEINRELCVTCHVVGFELTDPATGDFLFQSVGHTFEALPCVDEQGIPFVGDCDLADRSFAGCTECHSEANALTLYETITGELNALLDQLWVDSNTDGVIDATDAGLLPQVIALGNVEDLDPSDDLITVPEGVMWNAQIAHTDDRPYFADAVVYKGLAGDDEDPEDGVPDGIHWSAHKASGNGVHAPAFLKALLQASIDELTAWLAP